MPGMSGQTFIMEIRKFEQESKIAHVPIIVLTAESDNAEKLNCLTKYGANEYLLKPIKLKELLVSVSKLISKEEKKGPKTILIVEDEALSAQLLSKMLAKQNNKPILCAQISEVK